jgi:hypothetical protein
MQYMCKNGFVLLWENKYVVSEKRDKYVFLDEAGKSTMKPNFQCAGNHEFLLEADSPPPKLSKDGTALTPGRGMPYGAGDYKFALDASEEMLGAMPKQEKAVVELVKAAGKEYLSEAEIRKMMDGAVEQGKITTTQDPMKIFMFYRSSLARKGFLTKMEG